MLQLYTQFIVNLIFNSHKDQFVRVRNIHIRFVIENDRMVTELKLILLKAEEFVVISEYLGDVGCW